MLIIIIFSIGAASSLIYWASVCFCWAITLCIFIFIVSLHVLSELWCTNVLLCGVLPAWQCTTSSFNCINKLLCREVVNHQVFDFVMKADLFQTAFVSVDCMCMFARRSYIEQSLDLLLSNPWTLFWCMSSGLGLNSPLCDSLLNNNTKTRLFRQIFIFPLSNQIID